MAQAVINERAIKKAVKEALAESLRENRELLHEVLEDFALAEAIQEGRKIPLVSRGTVFRTLRGKR